MSIFYLHLTENGIRLEDLEGAVHPDIEAAAADAIHQIRKMLAMDIAETGCADFARAIDITGADGTSRHITFSQAVSVSV